MLVTKFKHFICIHVDKKAEKKFFDALGNLTSCFSNVFLAKKREDVIYGHYSRLQVKVQINFSNSGGYLQYKFEFFRPNFLGRF